MPKFSHAFTFAAEVLSDDFYGKDITPEMFAKALRDRIDTIMKDDPKQMLEAVEVFDTMVNQEESPNGAGSQKAEEEG